MSAPKTMPVQKPLRSHEPGAVREEVAMMAYEVYSHIYGEQEALITGGCRGGFGCGELIAFLYARNFPKNEWAGRVDEALTGMRL